MLYNVDQFDPIGESKNFPEIVTVRPALE